MAKIKASEIEKLLSEGIIDSETAERMRARDEQTKSKNSAKITTFFGVLGSLLIGLGCILLFGKNWASMSTWLKTVVALLPLLISQALMIYVLREKENSAAWRESVAVLMCAGVFAAVALVGQIYHVVYSTKEFLTTCALLIFPAIYLLGSAAALPVYLAAILSAGLSAYPTLGLLLLPLLFIARVVWQDKLSGKSVFVQYCSFFAMFSYILTHSPNKYISSISLFLAALALDNLVNSDESTSKRPFMKTSGLGLLVLFFISSFEFSRNFSSGMAAMHWSTVAVSVLSASLAVFALMRGDFSPDDSISNFIKNSLNPTQILLAGGIWTLAVFIFGIFNSTSIVVFNLIIIIYSALLIHNGVQNNHYPSANSGMLLATLLIIIRFTDSFMSIAVRGFAFIIVGIAFLVINIGISRRRKG